MTTRDSTVSAADADIAVVVVTHQSASTIDDCLSRLRAATGVAAIRVVDNRSDDGSLELIQRHATADPRVHFIANPDNPGFGVACNQGAADVSGRAPTCCWLAFVNPDAMVEHDTLTRLRALAIGTDQNPDQPEPVAAGPILLGADLVGEDGVRDPAARRNALDFGAMLAGWFARTRRSSGAAGMTIPVDDTLILQPVAAISGALMFLPRTLFEQVGGFDEGYRLHAEDLDLCSRVAESGARIAVANQVRVVHVRGVSSRSRPVFVEWHKHRGLWRYFCKFEADQRGPLLRAGVFAAIWLRFPLAATRAWLSSRRAGA